MVKYANLTVWLNEKPSHQGNLSFSSNLLNFRFVFQIYYHLSHGDGRAILPLIESTLDIRMDATVEWLHYSVEVSNLQFNNHYLRGTCWWNYHSVLFVFSSLSLKTLFSHLFIWFILCRSFFKFSICEEIELNSIF